MFFSQVKLQLVWSRLKSWSDYFDSGFSSATRETEHVRWYKYVTDFSAGTVVIADSEPPNLTIAKVLIILHIPCIDAKSAKTELLKLINKREKKNQLKYRELYQCRSLKEACRWIFSEYPHEILFIPQGLHLKLANINEANKMLPLFCL